MSCMINPEAGRESEFEVKAEKPLNIAVIGGGPAGMAAAAYLARKGHRVELFEKSGKLGGQLNAASIPPFKEEIGKVVEYLKNVPEGRNIIVIGEGLTGLETAEFLARKGKHVTVLEMQDDVAAGVFPMVKKLFSKG